MHKPVQKYFVLACCWSLETIPVELHVVHYTPHPQSLMCYQVSVSTRMCATSTVLSRLKWDLLYKINVRFRGQQSYMFLPWNICCLQWRVFDFKTCAVLTLCSSSFNMIIWCLSPQTGFSLGKTVGSQVSFHSHLPTSRPFADAVLQFYFVEAFQHVSYTTTE